MKKTGYIQLVLITATLASCKSTALLQNSCPIPKDSTNQNDVFIPDSCRSTLVRENYYGIVGTFLNNIFFLYSPGPSNSSPLKFRLATEGYHRSYFVVRGGFGASSKSASA
jgi:hypothetical protein